MNENPLKENTPTTTSAGHAASDLREAASGFAKKTGEQAAQVKDRAKVAAVAMKDSATVKAEHYKTVVSDKACQAKESAQQQWNTGRVKAKEIHVTTEDYIRQNPTKAVLSAVGVGFLLGLIARR